MKRALLIGMMAVAMTVPPAFAVAPPDCGNNCPALPSAYGAFLDTGAQILDTAITMAIYFASFQFMHLWG